MMSLSGLLKRRTYKSPCLGAYLKYIIDRFCVAFRVAFLFLFTYFNPKSKYLLLDSVIYFGLQMPRNQGFKKI